MPTTVASSSRNAARIVLAILSLAGAALAEGWRGSISAGTGISHDAWIGPGYFREPWYGGQLEVGYRHWSGSVAYGARRVARDGSLALGFRWALRPDGSGFGVALQGSVGIERGSGLADSRETLTVVSATAHWRWKLGVAFVDVGAGPAVTFQSYRFPTKDYEALNGKLMNSVCFGVCHGAGEQNPNSFDLSVAIGLGL